MPLRPKAYSILKKCFHCYKNGEKSCVCYGWRKASGIPQNETNKLTHELYNQLLFEDQPMYINASSIESNNHLLTFKDRKISFHSLNTRRYMIDNINSLPHGHWRIGSETYNPLF
jgi:hypothetical protein